MSRFLRLAGLVLVAVGLVLGLLKRIGLLGTGECGPICECSTGAAECHCGHKTCLAPAPGLL